MKPTRAMAGLAALGLVAGGVTAVSGASSEEQIIAYAKRYTVQVITQNRFGLNKDEGGTLGGTGFLVDRERGWIITNAHVATRSPSTVTVSFKGGDAITARRIHVDAVLDLAVLQIDPDAIPSQATVATLECRAPPAQGTRVIAYGNPKRQRYVASQGIVTGVRNNLTADLVMTDAEIASGNSGGPLIRAEDGKVVGLVSSSDVSNASEDMPTNFAERIPSICRVLDMLRQGRDPDVRHLGVSLARSKNDLRPVIATAYAEQPSLRPGDLIVSVTGRSPVGSAGELFDLLRGTGPNVRMTIRRSGEGLKAIVARTFPVPDPLDASGVSFSGMVISEPWRLDEGSVNPNRYLRIHSTDYSGPFDVGPMDLVEAVDGRTFTSSRALFQYLSGLEQGRKVHLLLRTEVDGSQFYFSHQIVDVPLAELTLLDASGGAWDFTANATGTGGATTQ